MVTPNDQNYYSFEQHSSNNAQSYSQGFATTQPQTQSTSGYVVSRPLFDHSNSNRYSRYQAGYQYPVSVESPPHTTAASGTNWYSTANNQTPSNTYGRTNTGSERGAVTFNGTENTSALGSLAYASSLTSDPAPSFTSYQHQDPSQTRSNEVPQQARNAHTSSRNHHQQNKSSGVISDNSSHSTLPKCHQNQQVGSRRADHGRIAASGNNVAHQVSRSDPPRNWNQSPSYNRSSDAPRNLAYGSASQYHTNNDRHTHQNQQNNDAPPSERTPLAPVTVDPSQVYDPYHEYQRQAAKREAEAKAEAEAKKREEEAQREAQQQERSEARVEENIQADETSANRTKSKKKSALRKRTRKSQKSQTSNDADAAAAMTLLHTAGLSKAQNEDNLEDEMRKMFAKMREFNAKNPQLLSKLWQQERDQHLADQSAQKSTKDGKSADSTKTSTKTHVASRPDAAAKRQSKSHDVTVEQKNRAVEQRLSPSNNKAVENGTIWPLNKRDALAKSAVNLLPSYPGNSNKSISKEQMFQLLDANPNYPELCNEIEKRGFRIDRSQFAKDLLTAVPDVNKVGATGATAGQFPKTANTQNSTVSRLMNGANVAEPATSNIEVSTNKKKSTPKSKSKKNVTQNGISPASRNSSMSGDPSNLHSAPSSVGNTNKSLDPSLEGLDAVKQFNEQPPEPTPRAPNTIPRNASKNKTNSKSRLSAPVTPATKEDKARKSAFEDLVDLSILSDGEDVEPMATTVDPSHADSDSGLVSSHLPSPPQSVGEAIQKEQTAATAKENSTTSTEPNIQDSIDTLHQPLQGASRPIVPTTASQLTREPQDHMRARGPPPLPRGSATRPVQQPLVLPLQRHKALRRSTYNSKTIARDVLIATGRHPDMRQLNIHFEVLRPALGGRTDDVDLNTIRWDILDPGGPPPGSTTAAMRLSAVDEAHLADDEGESDDGSVSGEGNFSSWQATGSGPVAIFSAGSRTGAMLPAKPRVGRPGRPRKHITYSPPPRDANPDQSGQNYAKVVRRAEAERVVAPSSPRDTASAYTSLRTLNPDGTKKKGRPVGWRKWMQKSPGSAPAEKGPGGNVGRPKGSTKLKETDKRPPPPQYHVYKCEWQACGAELHNLATLRKHIHKKHGHPNGDGRYCCCWKECGHVKTVRDGQRVVSRFVSYEFPELETWKGHVEDAHIKPIAWELGDGPTEVFSGGEASEQSDAYMSDAQGRRVTPVVTMPTMQEITERAHQSANSSGPHRGKERAEEAARKEEKAALERRRQLGPGVDREGTNIVNGKRAQGFIDDDTDMGDGEVVAGSDEEMGNAQ